MGVWRGGGDKFQLTFACIGQGQLVQLSGELGVCTLTAKVQEYVGGREVVASGELVLAGGDIFATVLLDDLIYHFFFLPGAELPEISASTAAPKTTTFTLRGAIGGYGSVWWYDDVATWQNKKLSLAICIYQFSGNPNLTPSYILKYTFSTSTRQTHTTLTGPLGS